jgi:hypothetical protein
MSHRSALRTLTLAIALAALDKRGLGNRMVEMKPGEERSF